MDRVRMDAGKLAEGVEVENIKDARKWHGEGYEKIRGG